MNIIVFTAGGFTESLVSRVRDVDKMIKKWCVAYLWTSCL